MATHSLMLKFNEQPKGRVLITSTISKGKKSVSVYDFDFSEHSYKELDVEVIEHKEQGGSQEKECAAGMIETRGQVENAKDIQKLLYQKVPLLIEKLNTNSPSECLAVIQCLEKITAFTPLGR